MFTLEASFKRIEHINTEHDIKHTDDRIKLCGFSKSNEGVKVVSQFDRIEILLPVELHITQARYVCPVSTVQTN